MQTLATAVATALVLVSACSSSITKRSARMTVERYLAAVEADDPASASALLEPRLRRQLDIAAFRHQWRALAGELATHATRLREAAPADAIRLTSSVAKRGGARAQVEMYGKRWRISRGLAEATRHAEPRHALAGLLRALQTRDYYGALELLSSPLRRAVEHELEQRVGRVQSALEQPVRVRGTQARISLPDGGMVELSNEKGTWIVTRLE